MMLKKLLLKFILVFLLVTPGLSISAPSRQERVHQLILMRFSNGLQLTPAETQKLDKILRTSRQRKRQLKNQVTQQKLQLRRISSQGDAKKIEAQLKKVREAQNQLDRVDEEMFADVKLLLDPERLAQFVLIMDEIRRDVRAVRTEPVQDQANPYFAPQVPSEIQHRHPAPSGVEVW